MKRLISILLFCFVNYLIMANPVSLEKAKHAAENWSKEFNHNREIINTINRTIDDDVILYIFNFTEGWLMVSADDCTQPILGFSFQGKYLVEFEPEALKTRFSNFKQIQTEKKENTITDLDKWNEQVELTMNKLRDNREVEPLISVNWHQGWPFNAYCPLDDDPELPESFNGHHNTSCGPTAFAQILSYWCYPVHGYGYHHFWYERFNCWVEADFGSTYYNWNNMPISLNFYDPEPVYTDVANLMLHSAVAVDNAWNSGGGVCGYCTAAVKYFGYSPTCEVLYRDDFSNEEWHNYFRNDFDNGRPIMLSGCAEGSVEPWESGIHYGHFFVCDGYYGEDFYHINWGWGGYSNGYYALFGLGDFELENYALIGMEPNYTNNKLILNDPYTTDENTVALLHFDNDLSNQSNLTNMPSSHGSTSFIDNSELGLGQCLYLDNTNQSNQSYLDISHDTDLDLSGDWTIEMWFKPNSIEWTGNQALIDKPNNNKSTYYMCIEPGYSMESKSLFCNYSPTENVDSNPAFISTEKDFLDEGEWYHVAYIRNTTNKNLKLIIHNSERELIHYQSSPYCNEVAYQPMLNTNPLFIGTSNTPGTYFNGYIDELRISNIVRDFEISSTELSLVSPVGGENWQSGTTQEITWSCQNIEYLKLDYSTDGGTTWSNIVESINASTGEYAWIIPELNSNECKIKITDINNENTHVITENNFLIYTSANINLLSHNGSEYFLPGEYSTIGWTNYVISEILLQYTTNNGNTWNEIATVNSSIETYDWIIPTSYSAQCKIRLCDSNNDSICDQSDESFEIGPPHATGGSYLCDENTILLFHFSSDLINQSTLSEDGCIDDDNYSFSFDTPSWLGQCIFTDSYEGISVQHSDNLNLQNDWTIEMWFKINSLDAVLINKPTTGWESNYNIHVEAPDGHMEARFYDTNNNRYQISSPSGLINAGEWYHVTFINNRAENQISLIVRDNDLSIEFEESLSYPTDTNVAISDEPLTIGWNSDGFFDEVRISNVIREFEDQLVANFTADTNSGTTPLTVNFLDSSTGNPTAWQWDFDNNGVIDSNEENPEFTYNQAGLYSVKLTVNDGSEYISETKTDYIAADGTGIDSEAIPLKTRLVGNYPNPFNPSTKICYEIQKSGFVTIELYNVKGQKVNSLVNAIQSAGRKTIIWDGKNNYNKHVGSGLYFYKLSINGKSYPTRKCILLK